ncbi:hypothetical protein Tsubulata_022924, partial [Turnera subulata]
MEEYGFCNKVFKDNLRAPSRFCWSNNNNNALIACENGYRVVQKAFQEANGFFQRHDYDSVRKSETIAPRAQGSCDTTFITPPAPASPLVERNRQMRILIAMALFTTHQLSP